MSRNVLITGATGRVGRHAAREFRRAGWNVQLFRRGDDLTRCAAGVDVIVNGMNPPNYHDWQGQLPQITRQHIAAARATGATVILPGNVYNYGPVCHGAWHAQSPHQPNTRKGRIRVQIEEMYRASGVQTIVLRAGNFIDPEDGNDVMQLMYTRAIAKGRLGLAGDPSARQSWCHLPDWARACAALSDMRHSLGGFEDIPFAGHTFSADQLRNALQDLTGQQIRFARFPWLAIRLLSPAWELARELTEMRYLYNLDHALDGARLSELLPDFRDTPLKDVLAAKLAYQQVPTLAPHRQGLILPA